MKMHKLLLLCLTITVMGMVYYVLLMQPSKSAKESKKSPLACYVAGGNRLPDLFEMQTPQDNSIYFIETSCKSLTEGEITINARQACAVESAALSNPNYQIYLMYTSPGLVGDETTLSGKLLHTLTKIKNVKMLWLNYPRLIKGTIIEHLYTSGRIESSIFPFRDASDVARILVLSKFGGIYLDLDFVVLRSFDDLVSDFAGAQSEGEGVVNGAVLRSKLNGNGREFIKRSLEELRDHFNGKVRGYNGPTLVSRVLKKMCNVNKVKEMYQKNCSGFTVYPPDYFYPIPYHNWKLYYSSGQEKKIKSILKKSYAIHVWNTLSTGAISNSEKSIYRVIAKSYCPQVYSIAGEYL